MLLKAGNVKCWGNNSNGQLGNGTVNASKTPVNVIGVSGAVALTSGGLYGNFTCALLKTKTVKCWGYNGNGELGIGSIASQSKAKSVIGLKGVTGVSAGGEHACARFATGGVKCWGKNVYGELGNGTITDSTKPVVAAL